jgi:LPS O-antigen subunit length determinant protein (WzzB/FepE family)
MQLKYNAYTSIQTQLQIAKAKLQERTPAFTILKGAEVPVKPAGPKRMIFVAVMLLLTFMGTSVYILRNILKKQ